MKRVLILLLTTISLSSVVAQTGSPQATRSGVRETSFDEFRKQQQAEYDKFKKDSQAEYDAFRKKMNDEYAEFMRQTWESFPTHKPDKPVEEKTLPLVVYNEPEPAPAPAPQLQPIPKQEPKPEPKAEPTPQPTPTPQPKPAPQPKPKEIPVQPTVVVVPQPAPVPEPIAPVKPKEEVPTNRVTISYFGTLITVAFPASDNLKIRTLSENGVADAWNVLSDSKYDITIKNALDARKANDLCDWAYMNMLRGVTEKQYGKTNEAVLMQAFLMTQSGYRIRLAMASSKLYMLVASQYDIYELSYITLDGRKYYIVGDKSDSEFQICPSKFEKEQSLSLQIARLPKLGEEHTPKRKLTSKKGVTASVSVNKNLIDFFDTYPSACINGDYTTKWAAYANTPLDKNIQNSLYPVLCSPISNSTSNAIVSCVCRSSNKKSEIRSQKWRKKLRPGS